MLSSESCFLLPDHFIFLWYRRHGNGNEKRYPLGFDIPLSRILQP